MEKRKSKLNKDILEGLKAKIIRYFSNQGYTTSKQIEIILERMNRIAALYVENRIEQGIGKMGCVPDRISIDEMFVEFENDMPVGLEESLRKLTESQLGHELFHAASRTESKDESTGEIVRNAGIRRTIITENVDINKIDKQEYLEAIFNCLHNINSNNKKLNNRISFRLNVGLDEGITQMMAEKVWGYVVSPQSDHYRDNKKFAKILDCTLGERVLYNSYFFKTKELDEECNELAGDNSFYSTFNRILDNYDMADTLSTQSSFNEHDKRIYIDFINQMQPDLIKYFTANIIIPKIKQLSANERKEYLKKVFDCIKDDNEFYTQLSSCIKQMYKMQPDELAKVKQDSLTSMNKTMSIMNAFTKCIMSRELCDNLLLVYGNNIALKSNITAQTMILIPEDSLIEEELLATKFKQDSRKYTELVLQKHGIGFRESMSLIQKKSQFARVKVEARKQGYLILNSLSECENTNGLPIQIIRVPNDGKPIEYDDMKMISDRYSVTTIQDEILGKRSVVIDNVTGNTIDNPEIQNLARFTDVWRKGGLTFDKENSGHRMFYQNFSKFVYAQLKKSGTINIEEFYRQFNAPKNGIYKFLNTNQNIGIIESVYRMTDETFPLETELPQTSHELVKCQKREKEEQRKLLQEVVESVTPESIMDATKRSAKDTPGRVSDGVKKAASIFGRTRENNDKTISE